MAMNARAGSCRLTVSGCRGCVVSSTQDSSSYVNAEEFKPVSWRTRSPQGCDGAPRVPAKPRTFRGTRADGAAQRGSRAPAPTASPPSTTCAAPGSTPQPAAAAAPPPPAAAAGADAPTAASKPAAAGARPGDTADATSTAPATPASSSPQLTQKPALPPADYQLNQRLMAAATPGGVLDEALAHDLSVVNASTAFSRVAKVGAKAAGGESG